MKNNSPPTSIVNISNHDIRLKADSAHDVGSDDQFFVRSLHSTHDPESKEGSVRARVTHVRALAFDLEMQNKTTVPLKSELITFALTRFSL